MQNPAWVNRERMRIEKEIVLKAVKDALDKGYLISIDNGGEDFELAHSADFKEIKKSLFLTDEERIYIEQKLPSISMGWIYCVYGNDGYDVISDYTTNLEELLKGAHAIAAKYE